MIFAPSIEPEIPEYEYEVVETCMGELPVLRGVYECKADALYLMERYKAEYDQNKGPGHWSFDFSVRARIKED